MKASELDADIQCPICSGTGDEPGESQAYGVCPRCNGTGTINRYRDGPDGEIVISERYEDRGDHVVSVVETVPIRCEDTGGFEGRFGTWTPSDVTTGPMADYQDDVKDQLKNNPLGTGGPYQLPDTEPYNGARVSASDLPGGQWPADGDLTMNQVVSWYRTRGDERTASVYEKIQTELGL